MSTPPATDLSALDRRIADVRAFNRFYTRQIGLMHEGLLGSGFSLTEARVLFEVANGLDLTSTAICEALELDPGYLSRIVTRFENDDLLTRSPSRIDRRQSILSLTDAGRAAFAPLDERARAEISAMLAKLPDPEQEFLVQAMRGVTELLWNCARAHWTSRPPQPGDIGWVISRHGTLYAQEYGFNAKFEALVARVAGDFLADHDPACERCWIADRGGVRVGSVFIMRKSARIARLRLLIVEPSARGLGIGKTLVHDCIGFAREAGYHRLTLWTNDILTAARGIYQSAGFRMVSSAAHSDFGPAMVGEDWELDLKATAQA